MLSVQVWWKWDHNPDMTLITFLYRIHTDIPVFCSAFPISSQWKPTISQTREDHRTIAIVVHTLIRHTCRVTKVGFYCSLSAPNHTLTDRWDLCHVCYDIYFDLGWDVFFSHQWNKRRLLKAWQHFWSVWQSQFDRRMLHFVPDQHEQAFCLQNDT